jgi:putative transposase
VNYGFIAKYRSIWPTRTMCRLLGVSSSGFYDWLDRPMSQHERDNAQLLQAIKHSHEASDGTYGSPRVVRDLIDAGFVCSENRVARLMKAAGIKARHKRRHAPGQLEAAVHAIAPNLLDRQFEATGPNQKWAADFTYGAPAAACETDNPASCMAIPTVTARTICGIKANSPDNE